MAQDPTTVSGVNPDEAIPTVATVLAAEKGSIWDKIGIFRSIGSGGLAGIAAMAVMLGVHYGFHYDIPPAEAMSFVLTVAGVVAHRTSDTTIQQVQSVNSKAITIIKDIPVVTAPAAVINSRVNSTMRG